MDKPININGTYEFHKYADKKFPIEFSRTQKPLNFIHHIHWHECIELIYFISGKAMIINDDETYYAETGDCVIINSCSFHDIRANDSNLDMCVFLIEKSFLENFGFELNDKTFQTKITDKFNTEKILSAIDYFENKTKNFELAIKINILDIILNCFLNFTMDETCLEKTDKNIVIQKAINYIKVNFKNKITVDELAKVSNLSKFYFCHLFKEQTLKTPLEFINEFRCNYALQLLTHDTLNISQVCNESGFETPSYFTKLFKQQFGVSPSEYKNIVNPKKH